MDEPVRRVTKAEAAEELEISLSTLDRKIRKGEVEVAREGSRVYVRMHGPEYLSDEEMLRRAIARESASASRRPYEELEKAYRKETAAHKETKELLNMVRVTAVVLLVLLVGSVLVWWLVLT